MILSVKIYVHPWPDFSFLASGFRLLYSAPMFDIVKTEISTAADKLKHLRRFL
jgi:hypothetical protein